jgi:hypothetical protein
MRFFCVVMKNDALGPRAMLLRTKAAAFAVAFLGAFVAAAIAAPASAAGNRGTAVAIAAIRHDLPLLLAARLRDVHVKPSVDWVVANGNNAVAMWHAGKNRGIVSLRFRSDRWWWRGAATATWPGEWTPMWVPGRQASCFGYAVAPGPPSAHDLLAQGFIDKALADELSDRLRATPTTGIPELKECFPDTRYIKSPTDAYDATFFHKEDVGWRWFTLHGRAAAGSSKATIPGADTYYVFTLSAQAFPADAPPPTITFASGSTFEVWFPYVLPTDRRYTLRITGVLPEPASISGTLRNNVLRFVLPSFTLRTDVPAQGEIEAASV